MFLRVGGRSGGEFEEMEDGYVPARKSNFLRFSGSPLWSLQLSRLRCIDIMEGGNAKTNLLLCNDCKNGVRYNSLFDFSRHQNQCSQYQRRIQHQLEEFDAIEFEDIEHDLDYDKNNKSDVETNKVRCEYCKNGKEYIDLAKHLRYCSVYINHQSSLGEALHQEGRPELEINNESIQIARRLESDEAFTHHVDYTAETNMYTGFTHHAPHEDTNYSLLAVPPLKRVSQRIVLEKPPEEHEDEDRFHFDILDDEVHEFSNDYDSDDDDTITEEEEAEDQNSFFPTNQGTAVESTDELKWKSQDQDKYHPDNFDDGRIEYFACPRNQARRNSLPVHMNAQLDLLVMLRKASAPLYLYDSIFDWIKAYSKESPGLFEQNEFSSRERFIDYLANRFHTNSRRPRQINLKMPRDDRIISLPKFDFVQELLSLLHDSDLMRPENFVEGYDVYTGRSLDGCDFWINDSIKEDDMFAVPSPTNAEKVIHHLYCGTKFQRARDRFCNKPDHMPVPLILFYDEANVDFFAGLKSAPIMFSLGLFKNSCRARLLFWRVLAIVPNLSAGKGKSDTTTPDDKAKDHHHILREALSELERISHHGGIRTEVNGRKVTLKLWIQFVIGDTKGHNELCGSMNSSQATVAMNDCLCQRGTLSEIPMKCEPKTLEMVRKAKSIEHPETLEDIGQRDLDNVFDHLPMGHRTRGIHACTLYECLHVFGQGIYAYIAEAVGEFMTASKTKKEQKGSKVKRNEFDKLFRVMSRLLERQSERDFPRRSERSSITDNSRLTAMEKQGNALCLLVLLHTADAQWLLNPFLTQRNIKLKTLKTALLGVIAYERWLLQPNPAHEVLQASATINRVMEALRDSFRRGEDTDGWDIPKFHAAVRMYQQILGDGPAEGFDSRHGEMFHKEVAKGAARRTQKRQETMVAQMGNRLFEDITTNIAVGYSQDDLLMLKKRKRQEESDITKPSMFERNTQGSTATERSYFRGDYKVDSTCEVFGEYHQRIPRRHAMRNKDGYDTRIRWTNKLKNSSRAGSFRNMIQALSMAAANDGWEDEFLIAGYTSVKKYDEVQKKNVRYRCDPQFRGRIWRDWGNFRFATGYDSMSPAMILGFVIFKTPGFPTPFLVDRYGKGNIPRNATDSRCYIVVWPTKDTINIEDNFITRVSLHNSEKGIYILPMEQLIGPVCAVPDIHNTWKFKQDLDAWLIVKPKRMWGDEFSKWIKHGVCYVEEDPQGNHLTRLEDDEEDQSVMSQDENNDSDAGDGTNAVAADMRDDSNDEFEEIEENSTSGPHDDDSMDRASDFSRPYSRTKSGGRKGSIQCSGIANKRRKNKRPKS